MNIGYEAKRIFHNSTGLGNYSRDLVKILSTFYPENTYYLYNPKPGKDSLFTPQGPVEEKLPGKLKDMIFNRYWRHKKVVNDLERDNIQIFHGLSGEIPVGLYKKNIKSVVTIHDLIFLRYPEFYTRLDRSIYKKKFQHAVKEADVVIAVSDQTRKDIVQFLEVDESKLMVIYQGCQKEYKQAYGLEAIQKMLQKYHLPQDYILNVGTVESRKNVLSAVKAIKNIETHLVIVGSLTSYGKSVQEYIQQEKLENKVTFLKGLSTYELALLYQGALVFIYPSLFEGFGIPIIEALFSKTPVITTNYGCFPEAGGPDSIYVDPNNVKEISLAISQLLDSPEERNKIAEKGYQYVQKFNDDFIASEMIQVYKDLLK
ncbi:glycosyltransferase family 4 protein [Salinimicrobium terrae]|uniref:glycosyltransferase family 4 protein n=1 Tax=Salinimicrobium terrae TaxID=470866 RepID=UPI0003FB5C16|nr:glycosyltransferase family 1 protein [Salinimicrobium terrae]